MFLSKWIHMNLLSLDEERVIVQKGEGPLVKLLISLGMKPIEVDMIEAYNFGGGFHCWSVDVRRTGKLESYFWIPWELFTDIILFCCDVLSF